MFMAICNLRDNLPSSCRILDATFGEGLFKSKLHKMTCVCFLNGVFFPATIIIFIIDFQTFGSIR